MLDHLYAAGIWSAGNGRTEGCIALEAVVHNGLCGHAADRILNLDVEVIDRGAETRQEARLHHRADPNGVGLLRVKCGVALVEALIADR